MKIEVFSDDETTARAAAKYIATEAAAAVAARGRFVMAVSGGRTPWIMLRALGDEEVRWERIHVVQVDERAAPAGHPDRNLTNLRQNLLEHSPIRPEQIHAMPVESPDLESAARQYASILSEIAGSLLRLRKGDPSIPAGRLRQDQSVIFADRASAGDLAA